MTEKEKNIENWVKLNNAPKETVDAAGRLARLELEKFNIGYVLPGLQNLNGQVRVINDMAAGKVGYRWYNELVERCQEDDFSEEEYDRLERFMKIKDEMMVTQQKKFDDFSKWVSDSRTGILADKIRMIEDMAGRVSDVDIRTKDDNTVIRCRIDGVLQPGRPLKTVLGEEDRRVVAASVFVDVLMDKGQQQGIRR